MFINKIILNNYRIYSGENELIFSTHPERNVSIISGENGYGKTSFLTAMVWCLYGKLMIDVDEKYKREIYEAGGYKKYATSNLNRLSSTEFINSYSVSIVFTDIFIPSIPCKELKVTRTFIIDKETDKVEIFIDGQINELTKQVGHEIFISDFILPKELAKFFFFDAEKIVSLAEMKSVEDKKKLSKAYAEVLGIKKYEDLKENLQDLRVRLKRNLATKKDKEKFETLQKKIKKLESLIDFNRDQIKNLAEEKDAKKRQSEQYQEKLIREGNSLTVEELINLKKIRDKLFDKGKQLRSQMKELLELAPFAITGKKFIETRVQLNQEAELNLNKLDPAIIRERIKRIVNQLKSELLENLKIDKKIGDKFLNDLEGYIADEFLPTNESDFKILLDFTERERNEFEAIYTNLKYSYSGTFKRLIQEEKNNRITLNKIIRKISNAESKENDLLVKEIRLEKTVIDQRIINIENKIAELHQENGALQRDISVMYRLVSETSKKIQLDKLDLGKDKEAEQLIEELEVFITKLKSTKKTALEERIKNELNRLMHKTEFIQRVEVEVGDEIIDIHLFDKREKIILKESLSKGEQQLYATSILKGLVDESNVSFPIFIDSPLQKFDKRHSKNIISEFYPYISKQVVLLPLLEKELIVSEYQALLPKVNNCFLIRNINDDSSKFEMIDPSNLFKAYIQDEHIHTH